METKTNSADVRWWFLAVTLVFIVVAVAGWTPGFYVVIAISAIQVLFFLAQEKSLTAFPTQIRVVYFVLTLFGMWPEVRLLVFAVLLLGTVNDGFEQLVAGIDAGPAKACAARGLGVPTDVHLADAPKRRSGCHSRGHASRPQRSV